MKVLAIDTSNLVMGVAVVDGGRVLGEMITNMKKNHSVRLMPAIQSLMEEVDVKPSELERIIVANGPGSYTGVRIGVSAAKSLAWSLGIPIAGVSSLEVLAQNGRYFDGLVSPLFDARRGQVYTGLYGKKEGVFENIEEDRILLLTDWLEQIREHKQQVLFVGHDLEKHAEVIRDQFGEKALFAAPTERSPRPGELALLGLRREPAESVHAFVPRYLQMAEAESKWLAAQKQE